MKRTKTETTYDKGPGPLRSASNRSFVLNSEPSEALVIHCADPRFRSAFQEFISTELGLGHFTLLSLAGGAGPFVLFEPKSVQAIQLMDQIRLFISSGTIVEVIIISHSDCKWYAHSMPDCSADQILNREITDLKRFARMIQLENAKISIRTFIAVLDQDNICFKIVPPS